MTPAALTGASKVKRSIMMPPSVAENRVLLRMSNQKRCSWNGCQNGPSPSSHRLSIKSSAVSVIYPVLVVGGTAARGDFDLVEIHPGLEDIAAKAEARTPCIEIFPEIVEACAADSKEWEIL